MSAKTAWARLLLLLWALLLPTLANAAPLHNLDVNLTLPAGVQLSEVCVVGLLDDSVGKSSCQPASSGPASCKVMAGKDGCICETVGDTSAASCASYFSVAPAPRVQCKSVQGRSGGQPGKALVLEVPNASGLVLEKVEKNSVALRFVSSSQPQLRVLGGDFLESSLLNLRDIGQQRSGRLYFTQVALEPRCGEHVLVSDHPPDTSVCLTLPGRKEVDQALGTPVRLPTVVERVQDRRVHVVLGRCNTTPAGDVLEGTWQSDRAPPDILLRYRTFHVSWKPPECFPPVPAKGAKASKWCPELYTGDQKKCAEDDAEAASPSNAGERACHYECRLTQPTTGSVPVLFKHTYQCGPYELPNDWPDLVPLGPRSTLTSYVDPSRQMMCVEYDLKDWRSRTWRNQLDSIDVQLPTGSTYRIAIARQPDGHCNRGFHILPASGVGCHSPISYQYVGARGYDRDSIPLSGSGIQTKSPAELTRRSFSFGIAPGVGMQHIRAASRGRGFASLEIDAMAQLDGLRFNNLIPRLRLFPQLRFSALFSRQGYHVDEAEDAGIAERWRSLPYLRFFLEGLLVHEGNIGYIALGGGVGHGRPTFTRDADRLPRGWLWSQRSVLGMHITSAVSLEATARLSFLEKEGVATFEAPDGAEFTGNPRWRAQGAEGPYRLLPPIFWGIFLRLNDPI